MNDTNRMPAHGPIQLEKQLCFALYEASRATTDIYRPLLDKLGITYPQYLVLLILWERGMCSVKEIGQLLHLDSGTLSPLLKRLESTGLIRRQRRTNDERVVDISLTPAGQALQEPATAIPAQFACELDLTYDEYRDLLSLLQKLTRQLHARK
jgi:DNA-binding MarR family transcriptional regulator